jgi:hypothetical protein
MKTHPPPPLFLEERGKMFTPLLFAREGVGG